MANKQIRLSELKREDREKGGRWKGSVVKSPLRYPGGKAKVSNILLRYAPPHDSYIEPFAGGASMFFSKPLVRRNWINDLHPGIYAFYTAVRDYYNEFLELCVKQRGNLRQIFDYWTKERTDLMRLTKNESIVERAVQFFFINRTVWGGRVIYDPTRSSRLYFSNPEGWNKIANKLKYMRKVSEKLKGAKITCLPFEKCFKSAKSETFIYCDPPYFRDSICAKTDRLYDGEFPVSAHKKLVKLATASDAKIMISYDDCGEVRELFNSDKWNIKELKWKYCGRHALTNEERENNIKEKKVLGNELLIMNYAEECND